MFFLHSFHDLRLEAVGIVAILGEASTARVAQISALSWCHVLPRLMPAPQALLKHSRERRLPVEGGTVVGVYSGNTRNELNFFCHLLHPRELQRYEVELLTVKCKPVHKSQSQDPYRVRSLGGICYVSLFGFASAIALLIAACIRDDGWALLATILLASTSSLVGFASRCKVEFKTPERKPLPGIPDSDLVIFYPSQNAFRIIRCDEYTARLYFTAEILRPLRDDKAYRIYALLSSVTLIGGLICLGNATQVLAVAYAGVYILLSIMYWLISALDDEKQWICPYTVDVHDFKCPDTSNTKIPDSTTTTAKPTTTTTDLEANKSNTVPKTAPTTELPKRIFTMALWEAIALTGASTWITRLRAVPQTPVWQEWLDLAATAARTATTPTCKGTELIYDANTQRSQVIISEWPFRDELARLLKSAPTTEKNRPSWSDEQVQEVAPDIVQRP